MTNTKKTYEEQDDAFENFKNLAQKLVVIPKEEIDKKVKEENKRRSSKKRRVTRPSSKRHSKVKSRSGH